MIDVFFFAVILEIEIRINFSFFFSINALIMLSNQSHIESSNGIKLKMASSMKSFSFTIDRFDKSIITSCMLVVENVRMCGGGEEYKKVRFFYRFFICESTIIRSAIEHKFIK